MKEAVIVEGLRSPIGRHNGGLSSVRPDDLLAEVLKALVARTGLDPAQIEDVYAGCGNQAGEDNRDVARMAALLAGFPVEVPGVTIVIALLRWKRSIWQPSRSWPGRATSIWPAVSSR